MSHWLYKGEQLLESPENYFGFVYLITNLKSGKKYIGRKYFGTTRRVKVAGKKRRKVVRKDSNWREIFHWLPQLEEMGKFGGR